MNDPIRILLVEDEEINNYIATRLIQKALPGAEVTSCLHGKQAIDLLLEMKHDASKLPDVILLDINMPVMNGWEFLDEYTHQNIDPEGKSAIFILSSTVFSEDINRAREYPEVKDFICKPLDVTKIREFFNAKEATV
ncbi:MAG TPA: response regulator [Mucilaginibacter sp.]